jgi:uncharacterized protein YceH (UPF0502 family)
MDLRLSPREARVIGCLIEKEITTPDQYPLSLNALVAACNQKNNRDPVMELTEADVHATLEDLGRRRLVAAESGFGSRVTRYRHRFCNTEFGSVQLSAQETAVVCELLLRGPQMPGELRSRASRMAPFADVAEMERVLDRLAAREDGPFVEKLVREPGRRESRYVHRFGEADPVSAARPQPPVEAQLQQAPSAASPGAATGASAADDDVRAAIDALRREVADLRAEVEALQAVLRERDAGG